MKKQTKKLGLNKKTIFNLQPSEMNKKIGGQWTAITCFHCGHGGGGTINGNTCPGHNTCYTC
jgi:hypothetical protein